jgi:hypothetical protein
MSSFTVEIDGYVVDVDTHIITEDDCVYDILRIDALKDKGGEYQSLCILSLEEAIYIAYENDLEEKRADDKFMYEQGNFL